MDHFLLWGGGGVASLEKSDVGSRNSGTVPGQIQENPASWRGVWVRPSILVFPALKEFLWIPLEFLWISHERERSQWIGEGTSSN